MAKDNSRTPNFILFIYHNSGYLLSKELNYLGKVFFLVICSWENKIPRSKKKGEHSSW